MRTAEEVDLGEVPIAVVQQVLEDHPVSVAILFGSRATDRTRPDSDVDVAVELSSARPGDPDYNDAFFGLSADLSDALDTDEVDLVDLHTCPPPLARTIFDHGVLLVGEHARVRELRDRLPPKTEQKQPPGERFDDALSEIDELLG